MSNKDIKIYVTLTDNGCDEWETMYCGTIPPCDCIQQDINEEVDKGAEVKHEIWVDGVLYADYTE